MTTSHGEPENNDDTDAQTLMNEARESDGERIIELYGTKGGESKLSYAYVGHVTENPSMGWVYTTGVEGHLCSESVVESSLTNLNYGVSIRIVDKAVSLFAWGDSE